MGLRPEWSPNASTWNVAETFAAFLPDYPSMVSIRSVQTHARPLRIGERLNIVRYVNPPLPEQDTARGRGRPAVRHHSLQDENGTEIVGFRQEGVHLSRERVTSPVVRAIADVELAHQMTMPRVSSEPPSAFGRSTVSVGQVLPTLTMPITVKRCVKWVGASRDYFEGHHDRDFARSFGSPDFYLGVHFFHGLFGRYLTDWTGPHGVITRMDFRSWGVCFPSEVIVVVGMVTGTRDSDGSTWVDVAVECGTDRGRLYDADVTVRVG